MKKEIKHNLIETCSLSKKKIDTFVDDYSIIVDCRGNEIMSVKFYKTEMLRDLIREKGNKIRQELMNRTQLLARGMMEKVGIIKPTYEVK